MIKRAPALRPINYRKYRVEQTDLEDPDQITGIPLPKVCIESGHLIYNVEPRLGGRLSYWQHGVERVERHPLFINSRYSIDSKRFILKKIEMAWDCRIPGVTPEGESVGLVLTVGGVYLPTLKWRGGDWACAQQVSILAGNKGCFFEKKPSLFKALREMVVGVGFRVEPVRDDDAEALQSLMF